MGIPPVKGVILENYDNDEPINMNMATKTPFRQLCLCLAGALGQPLASSDMPANEAEWEKVLRFASGHLAPPLLRWALREQGLFSSLPSAIAEYLDAIYTLNLDRNRQYGDQLAHLIQALNSIGVRPVVLKGAATLVGGLYPTLGERMTGDIDVLIPATRLPEILEKLASLGYKACDGFGPIPDLEGLETRAHHYPPIISPEWPILVELHVNPVYLPFGKLLSSEEVFRDATPIAWRGVECCLPSPSHFLIHHVIHAYLVDTQHKLLSPSIRRLFEFVHASRTYGEQIDWNAVRSRFDSLGYRKTLRDYAALAKVCLGFDVPPEIEITDWDRYRIEHHLIRLDLSHPAVDWSMNALYALKSRLGNLRRNPGSIKKLFKADFYSKLAGDILRR